MSQTTEEIVRAFESAAKDGFRSVVVRTDPMTVSQAADVLKKLPADKTFNPAGLAGHLGKLSAAERIVRLGKTSSAMVLTVSIPGDRKAAFEWVNGTLDQLGAAGVKMNLGPKKPTDAKVYWGTPDINTLIEIGGGDD